MPYNVNMTVQWSRRKYTKEQFAEAVKNSRSQRECVRLLGQNPDAGGIYYGIKAAVADLGLDISHWTGQGWNKGDTFGLAKRNTIPLSEILVENSSYMNTSNLKSRLYKEGLKTKSCEICAITEWMGQPAPLSLDHINGVRTDNRIENLRILCYNCHGQTDTYCTKNIKYQKDNACVSQWQRKYVEDVSSPSSSLGAGTL